MKIWVYVNPSSHIHFLRINPYIKIFGLKNMAVFKVLDGYC